MAIFIWRLLSNRVPVDTKLQWRKIELASKCYCFPNSPGIESPSHLFIHGLGATRVWQTFDSWFCGTSKALCATDTIPDRLERWANRVQQSGRKHLCRTMPGLILWFLWAERNRCRHDEAPFKSHHVSWQVQMHVKKLMDNGQIGEKHWKEMRMTLMPSTQSEGRRRARVVRSIKWNPPDHPWVKFNSACLYHDDSGQASGGGVVRDHLGYMKSAFHMPLTASSELEANLKALLFGVTLAREFGTHVWVESEASQLICLAKSRDYGPANVRQDMARLRIFQKENPMCFTHSHREGNKAAAYLAKMGEESPTLRTFDDRSAPRMLKAIVRIDQMGMPNISVDDEV